MQKRPYGKSGIDLSVIGFGGILVTDESKADASRIVSKAIETGINYFDVAPSYGNAQEMLGPALAPYRKDVFLACKTNVRDAEGARKDMENSFRLLKTDWFDLYQLHGAAGREETEKILAPGGALETLDKAKQRGDVRFLGFSAHSEEAALTLMEAYDFDSILFPVNWITWFSGDFGRKVLPAARKKGLSILALKSLAKMAIPQGQPRPEEKAWYHPVESYEEALRGLRFTLGTEGVTAAVSPGVEQLFDWMVKAEKEWTPLSEQELKQMKADAGDKSLIFDANHSQW